ncbi:MAG: helix-turn-helix domain-containing protein [Actinomycetes bacterium]|jgi:transcriptional regulator with XRE-family HTH domain|nr:helix-turn-helix transcriptional regulator [Candidatus Nanopelagicales bacterium]MDP4825093.1 helix-turn-helix transcriptional regulator [Candidatus Nanopelagicales bacterium]MDP4888469.1 helix-turn-helix transcriptional regulator [Candidatus Nanopelagicales bacterium]
MAGIDVGDIGGFIRQQRDSASMSIRQLAQASGVSNPYLSQIERGLRRPSAEMLARIAGALRLSAETLYVQAGILAEPEGDSSVATALARDLSLTDTQRRTLLDIYAAFQAENRLREEATTTKGSTS